MLAQEVPAPGELENAPAQDILRWALARHGRRVVLTSSFGIESAALLHMATAEEPAIPVVFLDTGMHFPETLEHRDALTRLLGLNLRVYRATPEQVAATRSRLEDRSNTRGVCCDAVKVELMNRALRHAECWIAGLRRDQSPTRRATPVIQRLESGIVKVHPLAAWTTERVHAYMTEQGLPFHPLWHQGYTSIGCAPCTRPPLVAREMRSGRWPGRAKTECGLHAR